MPITDPQNQDETTQTSPESVRVSGGYLLRKPVDVDSRAVCELIASCPPLDTNSLYCNLLQCTHFSDTCIVAERDARIRGWVSAYRPPPEPDTLFIWQVAVHQEARGCGLANALIRSLLARDAAHGVRQLKATIMPRNQAASALFRSIADSFNTSFTTWEHFEKEKHFGGDHPSEHMVMIGPWSPGAAAGSVQPHGSFA